MRGLVIAGTDGSAPATAAVEWAADDARRAGAELRIVHVLDRGPYAITGVAVPVEPEDVLMRAAERVLKQAETAARVRCPETRITTQVIEGVPSEVLLDQAREADELVLGDRGLGGFARALLGSVSTRLAVHAPCTVVVVRTAPGEPSHEIAVGVDDSEHSEAAIAYAFEEAALRGATLHLVHAWQVPVHAFAPEISYEPGTIRDSVRRMVRERTASIQAGYPEVRTVTDTPCAHPVDALTGPDFDLVVVGTRGRGPIASLLLGSVSRGVLHHARRTVAVVRRAKEGP